MHNSDVLQVDCHCQNSIIFSGDPSISAVEMSFSSWAFTHPPLDV